ncbi:MAG: glycosyltransferase [Vampirovibrionia bacterium]
MEKTFLSIIICTYNRSAFLEKLLDSLTKMSLSQELFELIIVDNASTDNTKELSERYKPYFKNFIYHYEKQQGLSYARNTGIDISNGNVIAYIDDDATVNIEWGENVYNIYNTMTPQPAALGGKILPDWEIERPSWYPDELLSYVSCVNNGPEPKTITSNRIYGCNSIYLKEKLIQYGKFDPKLGRVENKQFTHEEKHLLHKMEENNEVIFYHPDIITYHFIPKERSTYKYLVERAIGSGISGAILDTISTYKHKHLIKNLIRDITFMLLSLIKLKEEKYFYMCSIRIIYAVFYILYRILLVFKK